MLPEHRLLREQLNAFNSIIVQEMCVIIIVKIVCIGQIILTHFAGFPRVDTYRLEHFIQPMQESVGWSDIASVIIVGFLKSSLIVALLKLCLTYQYANQYSFPQENSHRKSISSS